MHVFTKMFSHFMAIRQYITRKPASNFFYFLVVPTNKTTIWGLGALIELPVFKFTPS